VGLAGVSRRGRAPGLDEHHERHGSARQEASSNTGHRCGSFDGEMPDCKRQVASVAVSYFTDRA
jgi:hypothetical protein